MTEPPVHYAFAYVDGEPGDQPDAVKQLVIEALVGLPTNEFKAQAIGPGGNLGRRYRYSEKRLAELGDSKDSGTLYIDKLPEKGAAASVSVYLRHNPEIELRFQPPARLALVLDSRLPESAERVVEFLRRVGNRFDVLHGGAGSEASWDRASSEVSSTAIGDQPAAFRDRIIFDSGFLTRLRSKARRAYPVTLIGALLAAQLGSGSIASQFPDLDVEELEHGALIKFTTADAELTD
jgi:hypothetical protein